LVGSRGATRDLGTVQASGGRSLDCASRASSGWVRGRRGGDDRGQLHGTIGGGETDAVIAELRLLGRGGEPIDLGRTLASHGVAALPPNRVDVMSRTLETTLSIGPGEARSVRVSAGTGATALVAVTDGPVGAAEADELARLVRHMLRLDEDLSGFYAVAGADPRLAWATSGAGRMLRGATVFEDVVKTICTTNCAWSATERMVGALVQHLGTAGPGGGRAFPSPAAMAAASDGFYRDVVRAGYRGGYMTKLAGAVAGGELDLEGLTDPAIPDDEVEARLLRLPGVGPYAAAHVMLVSLGRYGLLVLDSWTRPTYAAITGRPASDVAIRRGFRRYGKFAGLAFWLLLTRDWVTDPG